MTQNRKYDDLLKTSYAQTPGAPTWAKGPLLTGIKRKGNDARNTGLINAILFSYFLSILYSVFPPDAVHFLNVISQC
ncbi:hypothetical protein AIG32_01270 [Salmonella enterica subsp. enterica]|nr:hypothetical protein [Salmonella enterica]ECJ4222128.1 hypothetical protein [Salmonella enterica subsp. enterica]